MKKYFLLALSVVLVALGSFACKKKDTSPTTPAPAPTVMNTFTATFTITFSATPTSTFTRTFTSTPTNTPTTTVTPTPVATFGNVSSNMDGAFNADATNLFKAVLSVGGSVSRIFVEFSEVPAKPFQVGVYDDTGSNYPNVLKVVSAQQSTGSIGWNAIDISPTVLAAGNYWIAIGGIGLQSEHAFTARYLTTSGQNLWISGIFTSPCPGGIPVSTGTMSIYGVCF